MAILPDGAETIWIAGSTRMDRGTLLQSSSLISRQQIRLRGGVKFSTGGRTGNGRARERLLYF
jgi:hypothetical protein